MLTSATVSPEGGESTDTLLEKPESVGKEAEDDTEEVSWREAGGRGDAEEATCWDVRKLYGERRLEDAEKRGIKLCFLEKDHLQKF